MVRSSLILCYLAIILSTAQYTQKFTSDNGIQYQYKNEPFARGEFGGVYEGIQENNLNNRVAIKIQKNFWGKKEVEILEQLSNSDKLIQYKDKAVLDDKTYIVMEYCSGGTLENRIRNSLSEDDIRKIFTQIALALKEIHERDIIYFDLKPGNIVFQNESIESLKLIDFGISQKCGNGVLSIGGSPDYEAPEGPDRKICTKSFDIWSLGIILRDMVHWPNRPTSADLNDLIRGMLKRKKEERLEIGDILDHRWLQPIDQVCQWSTCSNDKNCNETYQEISAAENGGNACSDHTVGDTRTCEDISHCDFGLEDLDKYLPELSQYMKELDQYLAELDDESHWYNAYGFFSIFY